MKKFIALLLVFVMALSMAACQSTDSGDTTPGTEGTTEAPVETTTAPVVAGPASALEVLNTIWGAYGDDEKFFAMGGDYNTPVDSAPGAVDVSVPDYLTGVLLVPEAETANVTEAASLVHGMNLNNFTCGVFGVSDTAAFAETMHTAVSNNPWMCGFPEKMVIAVIGDYVLVSFGINDAMNPFEGKLTSVYPDAQIVYSEALA